jgi:hypothetical protein
MLHSSTQAPSLPLPYPAPPWTKIKQGRWIDKAQAKKRFCHGSNLSKFEQAEIVSSPETPLLAQFTSLSQQRKTHTRKAKQGKKQNKTKDAQPSNGGCSLPKDSGFT